MKTIRAIAAALAAFVCLAPSAQAQTITGSFTSDNAYSVWVGTATAALTNVVPATYNTQNIQIRQGETFSFEYTNACYIYIATWSDIKDYQGLVGSFTGGVVIKTGDPQIQVAPSHILKSSTNFPTLAEINAVITGGAWVAPFAGPTAAAGVTLPHFNSTYLTLSVPGMDPNSKWVWHNSGGDTRGVWTPTSVYPNFVPFIAYDHGEFLLWRIPCDGLVGKSTVTINKTVVGNGATFNFTTTGTGLSNFSLTPGSNATDTKVFNNLAPGSFTVTETPLAGYNLTSLICTGDTDNGNVVNQSGGVVTIDLDEGENQTCTFTNTEVVKPPPEPKSCLVDVKAEVKCNPDGSVTLTLASTQPSGFTANTIELISQTPGITVSPPQQPYGATTTWTISGGTPGQVVTFTANATQNGGGSEQGADLCCSTEIKITIPDCPKPPVVDLKIEKTGATSPAQQVKAYSFDLKVTNVGSPFGSSGIVVKDVVPAGMQFDSAVGAPDWLCNAPPTIAAGGTLICTYTGTGPTSTGQVFSNIHIAATAIGEAPFPPFTNCADVGFTTASGLSDVNPADNTSCVTVRKPPLCPPPMIAGAVPGQCICPPGTVQQGQTCVPVPPVCQPPFVAGPVPGSCVCPPGTIQQGQTCIKPPIDCHPPMIPNANGTACVQPPPTCQPPMVPGPVAGSCVCPPGTKQRGRECVRQIECRPPTIPNANGTACVQPPPACRPPMVPGPVAGSCICPPGTKQRGRECVRQIECRPPARPNRAGTACLCPEGTIARGRECVPERAAPPRLPPGLPGIFPNGPRRDQPRDQRPDQPRGGGQQGPAGVR